MLSRQFLFDGPTLAAAMAKTFARRQTALELPSRALTESFASDSVIPQWFVEQTAASTHDVKTPEMRWQLNPQIFSHGWELPARHWPESRRPIEGIPADARSKPGSGGQLAAFVPSLDLVVTRQIGGSGEWQYEAYLRRACAAVLPQ